MHRHSRSAFRVPMVEPVKTRNQQHSKSARASIWEVNDIHSGPGSTGCGGCGSCGGCARRTPLRKHPK